MEQTIGHGGRREGAGRPKGSRNRPKLENASGEIIDKGLELARKNRADAQLKELELSRQMKRLAPLSLIRLSLDYIAAEWIEEFKNLFPLIQKSCHDLTAADMSAIESALITVQNRMANVSVPDKDFDEMHRQALKDDSK